MGNEARRDDEELGRVMSEIVEGAVYEVPYPFVKYDYENYDGQKIPSWKPGTEMECSQYSEREVADSVGKQILVVVGVHKPGRYPARVFYTRKWIDPDGKEYGRKKLRVKTLGTFKQLIKGYGFNVHAWGGIEYQIRTEAA
jgi:hypothetical protein